MGRGRKGKADDGEADTMQDPHLRLSEEEQRRLDALDAALSADDPRLARRLRSSRRIPLVGLVVGGGPSRGTVGVALVAVGIVTVLAAVLRSTPVAIAGCVAIALGGYLVLTCARIVRAGRRFDTWLQPRLLGRPGREQHPHDE
jgi:hypothetical protein